MTANSQPSLLFHPTANNEGWQSTASPACGACRSGQKTFLRSSERGRKILCRFLSRGAESADGRLLPELSAQCHA